MQTAFKYPRAMTLATLALGISADFLFYGRTPGISVPLFVLLCLIGLYIFGRIEGHQPTSANTWLGAAALVFAALTALRAEPTLLFLNAATCIGLILLQVGLFYGPSLASLPLTSYLFRPLAAAFEIGIRPPPMFVRIVARLMPRGEHTRYLAPVARGLALAVPIVAIFTILLAMADTIFASYVSAVISGKALLNILDLIPHMLLISAAMWACGGALLTALSSARVPAEGATQVMPGQPWQLGCIEALTILVLVDALFGGFMVVQAAYLFGGQDILTERGLTYADYARRGFFELVIVACLAIGLLWVLAGNTRRERNWQAPAFQATSALLIFLTLGLLGSAFQRMWLYEQAYGMTHLRLYTHVFMGWLAIALALLLVAILRDKLSWFQFGGFVAALATLALLTLADPETLIVQVNVARYHATGDPTVIGSGGDAVESGYDDLRPRREIDTNYLARLSPDATPALIAALPSLPPEQRAAVASALSEQRIELAQVAAESGWQGWHWARARALTALGGPP